MPRLLKPYGYYSANIGKLHFVPHANRDWREPYPDYGFDHAEISDEPGCYEDAYRAGLARFSQLLERKISEWKTLAAPLRGLKVVSYHRDLPYLASRYGLEIVGTIEVKPGIPATPGHLQELLACERRQHHVAAELAGSDHGMERRRHAGHVDLTQLIHVRQDRIELRLHASFLGLTQAERGQFRDVAHGFEGYARATHGAADATRSKGRLPTPSQV